jgi:hypothetical protein
MQMALSEMIVKTRQQTRILMLNLRRVGSVLTIMLGLTG